MWGDLSCSNQPWAGGGSCEDRERRRRLVRRFTLWPAPPSHPALALPGMEKPLFPEEASAFENDHE